MASLGDVVKIKGKVEGDVEALDKIKKMTNNNDKFMINRMPKDTKDEFKGFARECYFDDYGLAFKALWEFYKADARHLDILQRVMALEATVSGAQVQQSKTKNIALLNGKMIEVRK